MSTPKAMRARSLAEQITDLNDPAPKDFDPEDVNAYESESDNSGNEGGEDEARAHYESVGTSKLRKPQLVTLGPQYAGSRISRDAIDEDEEDDSFNRVFDDEALEEEEEALQSGSDELQDDEEAIDGPHGSSEGEMMSEEENYDSEEGNEDSQEEGDTSGTEFSDEEDERPARPKKSEQDGTIDRAELRKLMVQDQKSVAATLTEGAKADAEKGKAVKAQRAAFDSLLNTRIKLQKALVAANSLSAIEIKANDVEQAKDVVSAVEDAALRLWNNINALRASLQNSRTSQKRKHSEFAADTPLSTLWNESTAFEPSQISHRNSTLNFWSAKCRATTAVTQTQGRLNQNAKEQQLSDVLAGQLSDMSRLVAKTRMPRSCAPLQAASSAKKSTSLTNSAKSDETEVVSLPIYDDADFYSTLLQSLISQRSSEATTSLGNLNLNLNMQPWQAAREAKVKKVVDTKASKGRKLRYTVHEKLQNFMAAEDRGQWGERQCEDLFGSLFGRREVLGEVVEGLEDEEMQEWEGEEGLRLFAGA